MIEARWGNTPMSSRVLRALLRYHMLRLLALCLLDTVAN